MIKLKELELQKVQVEKGLELHKVQAELEIAKIKYAQPEGGPKANRLTK